MKKLIFILLVLPLTILAQKTYVPDNNFETYLENNGMGDGISNNDSVLTSNINTIIQLQIQSLAINDLTGIEDFANLQELECWNNNLSTLNLNQNVNLKYLSCGGNNLTTLLIDSCLNLEFLHCANNFLTSLDVSNNFLLNELRCYQNNLTSLDLSNNTNLIEIQCGGNFLNYLNTNNCSSLIILNCNDNVLNSINISTNTNLIELWCYNNNLDSLNINSNTLIERIYSGVNNLTQIDASNNPFLQVLECYANNITNLNLTNCTFLETLNCGENQINSLDITNNTYLKNLACADNNLTSIDVSNNIYLEDLYCEVNNINSLDLTNNINLDDLNCGLNNLTFLDLRSGSNLLITNYTSWGNPHLYCVNVDDTSWSNIHWTNIDNWTVFSTHCTYAKTYVPDDNFENYLENNNMGDGVFNNDSVLTQNINTVTHLNVSYNNILDLTGIEDFIALNELSCYSNLLTTLDLSNNTFLTELNCVANNLTSLDLRNGNNTNIIFLWTYTNYNLTCISVDDPVFSNANWLNSTSVAFSLDGNHYFSANCNTATYGCTDSLACNYNPTATIDDGSCLLPDGCTDPTACNYDASATCDDGTCLWVNIFISSSNVSCYGSVDGTIVATATGGILPYQYSLGAGMSQSNGNFINLGAGTYYVDVTDVNGCSSNQLVIINEPPPLISNNTINDCDSVLIGNNYYTISGTYTDTLTSVNGCDSVVNTNLTIEYSTATYDTISAAGSYYWAADGNTYNSSGIYTHISSTASGCDSISYLNLTITNTTGINDLINKRRIIKITNILGQTTPYIRNTPLFYIYDDGTVEKRITIE